MRKQWRQSPCAVVYLSAIYIILKWSSYFSSAAHRKLHVRFIFVSYVLKEFLNLVLFFFSSVPWIECRRHLLSFSSIYRLLLRDIDIGSIFYTSDTQQLDSFENSFEWHGIVFSIVIISTQHHSHRHTIHRIYSIYNNTLQWIVMCSFSFLFHSNISSKRFKRNGQTNKYPSSIFD